MNTLFLCPNCQNVLKIEKKAYICSSCKQKFPVDGEIPLLFIFDKSPKDGITRKIKDFYEKTPFPNYEDIDSKWSLVQKAKTGTFARLLNEQLPENSKILEVGCGTGQLGNFLGITKGRTVFSVDACLNSLRLASAFRKKNIIKNVNFVQMNLFKPVFKNNSFDLVICNGVLHHTADPYGGFKSISNLVKKDGYIVIGLYNKLGRFPNDIRRVIFDITGNKFTYLDSRLRDKSVGDKRKQTWFLDQYKNPHEFKHSIDEVLHWFERTGFEFINAIPKVRPFDQFSTNEKLFEKNPQGNSLDHLLVELGLMLEGGRDGGFFLMIGRKKGTI